uniref:J domain-containing protein n=1 Tax=Leptocylindrus danicus TaxID=163516 RepID=A0A7S2P3P3_9STRA
MTANTTPTLVLYTITNHKSSSSTTSTTKTHYNAQYIHTQSPILTLRAIQHQLHDVITALSPTGFHWRVRMEDQASQSQHKRNVSTTSPNYSWWDVQDENAKLPVRDMTMGELEALYNGNKKSSNNSNSNQGDAGSMAAGAAKSAFKGLTKAINNATNVSNSNENHSNANNPFAQVPVRVVVLKLLDLARIGEACTYRSNDHRPPAAPLPRRNNYNAASTTTPPSSNHHSGRTPPPQTAAAQPKSASTGARRVQEANLMDFGNSPTPPSARKTASNYPPKTPQPQLSRAEKLKREYAQNAAKQNRVWDDVDQRWVVQPIGTSQNKSNSNRSASASTSSSRAPTNKNSNTVNVGISLESSAVNVSGKSASVQAAVHARVNDMKKAQNAALQELRERERKAKAEEDAEDEVRRRLEPRIKAWSEEHGKKKQLRALLASLHIILWPEAKWKQVSIGDILDDKKARRCYLKATLKVHPDKTKDLDPEKRFIAKRVFDALSQAFTQFEGKHVG